MDYKTESFLIKSGSLLIILFSLLSFCITQIGLADFFPVLMDALWTICITTAFYKMMSNVKSLHSRNCLLVNYIIKILFIIIETVLNGKIELMMKVGDWINFINIAESYYVNDDYSNVLTNYPYLLNAMFHIFGLNIYLVRLVNVSLSSLAIYGCYRALDYLKVHGKPLRMSMYILCFMPFFVFYGATPLRESIYYFSIAWSTFFMIRWMCERRSKSLFYAVLFLAPSLSMHFKGYISILVIYMIAFVYEEVKRHIFRTKKIAGVFVTTIVSCIFFLGIHMLANYGVENILSMMDMVYSMHIGDIAGSMYLAGVHYDGSILNTVISTPIRMIYFFLSPMPWDFRGIIDVISFAMDSSVYLAFALLLIISLKRRKSMNRISIGYAQRTSIIVLLTLEVILTGAIYSWGTTTAGTAIRHRASLIPIICILFGLLIKDKRSIIFQPFELIRDNLYEESYTC